MRSEPWWRGAVIYQIYPRSFMDTNADGVGDLLGIVEKLDYIVSLGVDALWVSPFFKSPMLDFGYDISDYRDVDPLFGTLDDFDTLIYEAHQRGVKVMVDQVLSHTSSEHAWFTQSRESQDNPKADWYVWSDPKQDGTPPNNWLSIFGGSAWEWDSRRAQYYLHNFLKDQPDLNFHCAAVQDQILQEVEFWLARGVDGLRLDAINFCFHDKYLRDNPPKAAHERKARGFSEDNPYAFQWHTYNNTQPENLDFLKRLRTLMNRYPQAVSLGEITSDDSLATMAEYTADNDKLHMAYNFELLSEEFSAGYIKNTVTTLESRLNGGWPCWSIGNHDVPRVATRWGKNVGGDNLSILLNAMLLSLRGSVCCYQGDELGLTEAELSFEQLQDPYGITFWPKFKGRDGCRTPMPWDNTDQAGFTQAFPWLPIPEQHTAKNVAQQLTHKTSVLRSFQQFVNWRKQQAELLYGDIAFLPSCESTLAFTRSYEGGTVLAAFNLSQREQAMTLPGGDWEILDGHGLAATLDLSQMTLPPFGACFARHSGI
ncbi:MAG: alpha-glucosidase family protein [Cellvibrionaceae bacterium]|nr:alpha-glucosidase family protein [Cellvibrionaceae bacterium]